MRTLTVSAVVLAFALGCHGQRTAAPPVSAGSLPAPKTPATSTREQPPPPGTPKESPFPPVARTTLTNGMTVAVVTAKTLPIVQVRLLVRAGAGYGSSPGVATLTGDMLKDGGTRAMTSAEVLRTVETLGSDLRVSTDFDSTVLSLALSKDQLDAGLSLLSQVVREPRFDAGELHKLKARTTDESAGAARSSGAFTSTRLVFRELYPEKSAYATFGLVPSEIAKVDAAGVRAFYQRFYVPRSTTLVLAGDVEAGAAKTLADQHFGAWKGGDMPAVDFAPPRLADKTRVLVAHRPTSAQSDVYVAMLAPPRKSEVWPAVRVANQILGGGVASRLFAEVREQRSLAYRTNAQVFELAHNEQPLLVYAGTETAKTTQAVAGLLDELRGMTRRPPTKDETESARRYLSDVFAIRMETIGAIADMVVTQDTFGLPDGYWDAYRKRLLATAAPDATAAAERLYTPDRALIVVAGDADVIAGGLAMFGDVVVVDPEREFKVLRTLPRAASARR